MLGVGLSSYIDVERVREVESPAEALWDWMLDPSLQLFKVNLFHESVRLLDRQLQRGSRVLIRHNFFKLYRQTRVATINTLRDYEIGWAELAEGVDYFPHSQRFRIESLGSHRCRFSNRLRGRVDFPAAPLWWMPWFRLVTPRGLDAELRQIVEAIHAPSSPAA